MKLPDRCEMSNPAHHTRTDEEKELLLRPHVDNVFVLCAPKSSQMSTCVLEILEKQTNTKRFQEMVIRHALVPHSHESQELVAE